MPYSTALLNQKATQDSSEQQLGSDGDEKETLTEEERKGSVYEMFPLSSSTTYTWNISINVHDAIGSIQ